MIEETKPVSSSSMPAAAFITEFAIIPFDIYPSASAGYRRIPVISNVKMLK
jgi:hypothetical protein